MFDLLNDLRVVELSSFVAVPSAGMHLAQMGAEVLRIDAIGGGPDFRRWPLAPSGESLYWEGLNKGKKSIAIDLSRQEGRELALALATAEGEGRGLCLTNLPVEGFLSYERLAARRADIICVRLTGWPDGSPAVDYTVNAAMGVPLLTGPADDAAPVNHVLPAWDLLAGWQAAMAIVAAERTRMRTGQGADVRIALSDVAATSIGHLGMVAEAIVGDADRPRMGNDLFGAFGRDFLTADGERVMIVAITARQWRGMIDTLGLAEPVAALQDELGVDFMRDEGARFTHRSPLFALVEGAVAQRRLDELGAAFDAQGVTWARYQTLSQAIEDPRLVRGNPLFETIAHPSGLAYPAPGAAMTCPTWPRQPLSPAPRLGEHGAEVLADMLGLSDAEIGRLHDAGLVGKLSA